MAKAKISPQMIRQLRQMGEEVILKEGEKSKEYEENEEYKEDKEKKENQQKIAQMKAQKGAWAQKRIKEIEDEMKMLAQKRQEEMRKRIESSFAKAMEDKEKKEKMLLEKAIVPEVVSKPKRGLFWGRRIKTAQQQAQPETVGRRIGG